MVPIQVLSGSQDLWVLPLGKINCCLALCQLWSFPKQPQPSRQSYKYQVLQAAIAGRFWKKIKLADSRLPVLTEGLHGVSWKSPPGQSISFNLPSGLRPFAGLHTYAIPVGDFFALQGDLTSQIHSLGLRFSSKNKEYHLSWSTEDGKCSFLTSSKETLCTPWPQLRDALTLY